MHIPVVSPFRPAALPALALSDTAPLHVACALAVYFVFKRYEPVRPEIVVPLLVLPPAATAMLFSQHMHLALASLLSFPAFYIVILLSVTAYRLGPWHSLARYPGPVLLRVSKFAMAWHAAQGYTHVYIDQLHKQYGDVVRIGPNELSIRDASVIAPVMGASGLPKGPNWEGRTLHKIPAMIAVRPHAEHASRRRPWNRAFSTAALKGYEEIVARRAVQLVDALAECSGDLDLGKWFGYFAFDFMSDMAFGGGSDMLRDGDVGSHWHLVKGGLVYQTVLGHVPWLARYAYKIPGFGTAQKRLSAYGIGRAINRVKHGSQSKDIFYYLSNEDGKSEVPPLFPYVVADGVLAIIAGADTTSGVLTSLFYALLRHPETYKLLQEEVDEYYPPGENTLDTKHHGSMAYLTAALNETMRLFPALPSGSQRSTAKLGPKTFGEYFIPEGTQLSIHYWSVQRDPRYFYAPDEFLPERWLLATDPSASTHVPNFVHDTTAFVPFSFGPTNCVGKNLALQEMRMVVCLTMQQLQMRLASWWDPTEYEASLREYLVFQRGRLPVVVEKRADR